jgi:hypothetical protein
MANPQNDLIGYINEKIAGIFTSTSWVDTVIDTEYTVTAALDDGEEVGTDIDEDTNTVHFSYTGSTDIFDVLVEALIALGREIEEAEAAATTPDSFKYRTPTITRDANTGAYTVATDMLFYAA